MRARSLICAVLTLALLGACSGMPLRERLGMEPPSASQPEPPKSCLALSGGGLRSGAVSLGAIQGLYAAKALSRYELVSAVSGGGYPVYGLLDRMIRDKIALRDLLRERGKYFADVERNADFIESWDIYSALTLQPLGLPLSWLTGAYGSVQPSYIGHIHKTFVGDGAPSFAKPSLNQAKEIRRIQGFPVPIFGASASKGASQPRDDYPYSFAEYFELSPLGSGAPAIGYFPTMSRIVSLSEAVAVSSAAIDTPTSDAQLPGFAKALNFGSGSRFYTPTDKGEETHFYLADGGFIENLALLPLLRHGCTEILAFDSTDDLLFPFEAWRNFTERVEAEEPGWRVSDGRDLQSASGQTLPMRIGDRWNLPHHIWDAQLENGSRRVHVRLVKLGIDRRALEEYPPAVREFARQNWGEADPECNGEGTARRCSFPLEASVRQSFAPEEFRAYRLLGRWLAELALGTPHPASEVAVDGQPQRSLSTDNSETTESGASKP